MAAPADRTIKDLSGDWVMDRNVSDNTDDILKLQGVGWVTRKAISVATITLKIHEYPDSDNGNVLHIDSDQVLTGGLKGTSEARVTSGAERHHKDHIFGSIIGQSWLVRGTKSADDKVLPNANLKTKIGKDADNAKAHKFLRGEILPDGSASDGFLVENLGEEYGEGEGLYLHNWVVNQDSGYGWTAEQVWGFEIINGERRHTRRVAVTSKDGSNYLLARLVYEFVRPRTG